jgi:hypothetical protein
MQSPYTIYVYGYNKKGAVPAKICWLHLTSDLQHPNVLHCLVDQGQCSDTKSPKTCFPNLQI